MLIEQDLVPEFTVAQLAALRNDLACLGTLPEPTQWELLRLVERLQEQRVRTLKTLHIARETARQTLALLHSP